MKSIFSTTVLLFITTYGCAGGAEQVEDFRFRVERLVEGMPQPMELEVAPDGRVFFNEYGGKLKLYDPVTRVVKTVGELKVFTQQENGFLGFALDPKFAENGWVYCLYSPVGFDGQHLSRFTIHRDEMDVSSEKLLLRYEEQRRECCHHAGSVEFGPDGNLYFSTGDNTHPHGDSGGYAPIDERPGKEPWDAQKSAANTMSLAGKICRIRPKPDGSYEIPAGNLFPPGTPGTRPEIFAMGCRNPWRMSIDARTGFVYWGDVGPDARDTTARGPRGYDEINQARQAGNFGWPYFIAENEAYADYDYVTKMPGAKFDPARPVNVGPNNTGIRELPPAQPAFLAWPYAATERFPGGGGRTACAGPVYHAPKDVEKGQGFPANFDRSLLFWDWERPFMKWARLNADSRLIELVPFTKAVVLANKTDVIAKAQPQIDAGAALIKRPVDATFDAQGVLYLLDYGETWGPNKDSALLRITYQRGNLAPMARATSTVTGGREPLTTELSAAASTDPEGAPLQYAWTLQPGGRPLGNSATLKVTITEPGNYRAEVRVTDAQGASATANVALTVGNTAPSVAFEQPREGDFFTPGKTLAYRLRISDPEDGESAAKPDEFGMRTLVTTAYFRADGRNESLDPGLSLMKQSDCFNCHAVETPMIGPSFLAIAERYRDQAGAAEILNKKVREGGGGVWGQVPMLPHPQHTTDEVAIMLRWMFTLQKGKTGPSLTRGLSGELTVPQTDKPGTFHIEATYTDAGCPPAGSLSNSATVTLRSRRIEAESAILDPQNAPQVLSLGGAGSGRGIGATNHGHTLRFPNVNLAGSKTVTARIASAGAGGKIELRSNTPDGPLLATIEAPLTGKWDAWKETTVPLAASDRTDVIVLFINPGKVGLMNLDWLHFHE